MKVNKIINYWNEVDNTIIINPDVMSKIIDTIDWTKGTEEFNMLLAYTRYKDYMANYIEIDSNNNCIIVNKNASIIEKLSSIKEVDFYLLRDIFTVAEYA